jgi:hypothetical protein
LDQAPAIEELSTLKIDPEVIKAKPPEVYAEVFLKYEDLIETIEDV